MLLTRFLFVLFLTLTGSCSSDEVKQTDKGYTVKDPVILNRELKENSGLIVLDDILIMHNDGGDDPVLYEVDPQDGKITRRIRLTGTKNVDMEDITQDDRYIYLGDIGNNNNTCKDLVIYKIDKQEFKNNDQVSVEKIKYAYAEQTDFSRSNRKTNFDAEALVNVGDALLLFTKNWSDNKTALYQIPKQPGTYKLSRLAVFEVDGLITGGTYNPAEQMVVLSGYANYIPFIAELRNFSLQNLSSVVVKRSNISVPGSLQTEGIDLISGNDYYLSAEQSGGNPPVFYRLSR